MRSRFDLQRAALIVRADTSFSYSKLFTAVIVALIIGLTFLQEDRSIVGMQNKTFSVFLLLFIPPVFMNATIQKVRRRSSLSPASFTFAGLRPARAIQSA